MATSIHQFNAELYQEHLEEASFLYEQRLAYLHDPEVDWPSLRHWEARFEAHLDALVVGGAAALEVCRAQVAEGDPGIVHTALRLLCCHERKQDVFEIIAALDPTDVAALQAASRALCSDMPTSWRSDLVVEFQRQPERQGVYAYVIGFRRVNAEAVLIRSVADGVKHGWKEVSWALGRVGAHDSILPLRTLVVDGDDGVKESAAIALLRLGDEWVLAEASRHVHEHSWAHSVLAIGGHPRSTTSLLAVLQAPQPSPGAVLALGLLGDLAVVGPLLDLLDHEELARAAAVALNTITGADLHARVFVSYEFDVDELDAEERAAFEKDGSRPTKGREKYGDWERAPLLDKSGWRSWLEQNRHRFQRGPRWRMGQPYGPLALVRCLSAATTPYAIRSAAYEELVTRYRLDVPFEVNLTVPRQVRCLARLQQWATELSVASSPGRWYFAGQLQA